MPGKIKLNAPAPAPAEQRIDDDRGVRPPPRAGSIEMYILLCYNMALLMGSVAALIWVIFWQVGKEDEHLKLIALLVYAASGALAGGVLYQIRMFYKHYVKERDFDWKWFGKYISGPWEAVVMALAVLSLIQGGGAVIGGQTFSVTQGNKFAAFGFGALVGFGIREVIGWVGDIVSTMFPTKPKS